MMPMDIGLSSSSSSAAQAGNTGSFDFGSGKTTRTIAIVIGAVAGVALLGWLFLKARG